MTHSWVPLFYHEAKGKQVRREDRRLLSALSDHSHRLGCLLVQCTQSCVHLFVPQHSLYNHLNQPQEATSPGLDTYTGGPES